MDQTDPNISALFSAVRALLIALGGILAAHGLADTGVYVWVEAGAGSIMILGPAAWGVWNAIVNLRKARAVGVQAGVNLAASGQAVDKDGNPISQFAPDAAPPLPVTLKTADEIVKNFAPPASSIPKA